jgi:ethanolamine utilization protein EutQ (cupin superfamily)
MMHRSEACSYIQVVDETEDPERCNYHAETVRSPPAAQWFRLGVMPFLVCAAFLTYVIKFPAGSSGNAHPTTLESEAALKPMNFGMLSSFDGSSPEYFIEPGGRLVASMEPGSNHTSFLLDHRLQYIVDGEIQVTDGTGQTFTGKAGDVFYLPYGSNVTYHTPKSALTYVVVADHAPPIAPDVLKALKPETYGKQVYEKAQSTAISHFPNVRARKNERFQAYSKGLPSGTSSAFFDEVGCFKFTGKKLPSGKFPSWNFCCGIFYLAAGPAFTSSQYPHHYEVDFVLDGEFQYKAASNTQFYVKKGDFVHNPRNDNVRIETSDKAKFLSISLSDVDDFWR